MPPVTTILITGGCGYLGSQLLRTLPAAFPDSLIRVFDNFQRGTERALLDLPNEAQYEVFEGDLLDAGALRLAVRGVDVIVHLAAVVRTPMSFENPTWMHQVNHWGTAHLVEAALEAEVRRFVYPSTTAVYGPGGPFDETAPCRPLGPYADSKYRAEGAVRAGIDRGLNASILRLGMLYGLAPAVRFDGVMNRLLFRAGTGRALTVFGEGHQRRPVVHVDDAARAILIALEGSFDRETLNVASGNPSVLELVEGIRTAQPDVKVRFTEQDVLTHLSFEVDSTRARRLGWAPTVDHREAVAKFLLTLPA